jgi:hypothetical protein
MCQSRRIFRIRKRYPSVSESVGLAAIVAQGPRGSSRVADSKHVSSWKVDISSPKYLRLWPRIVVHIFRTGVSDRGTCGDVVLASIGPWASIVATTTSDFSTIQAKATPVSQCLQPALPIDALSRRILYVASSRARQPPLPHHFGARREFGDNKKKHSWAMTTVPGATARPQRPHADG